MLIKTTSRHKSVYEPGTMNIAEFERRAEEYFKGQRELPNRRNFLWNNYRFHEKHGLRAYRENFGRIFPNSPGADI